MPRLPPVITTTLPVKSYCARDRRHCAATSSSMRSRVLLDRGLAQRRDMAAREKALGALVIAQDLPRQRDLVDLGRTVGEPHHEALDHLIDERHLGRHAERSMDLQRAHRDVVEDLGHLRLHRRDVLAHLRDSPCTCRSARRCAAPAGGTARDRSRNRRSSPAPSACRPAASPGVVRESARSHIRSNALRTCPIVRIA